jgi:Protein of unknown function (DUF4239)
MLDRLYEIGDPWIIAMFSGVAVGCFVLAPIIGSKLGWTAPNKDRADYIVRAQATIISFTALILAFSLVQVHSNLRKTEELVDKEAAQLTLLNRQLTRYGDPGANSLREQLLAYATSVVENEWPALRTGQENGETTKRMQTLMQDIYSLDPQPGRHATIFGEMLKALDALVDFREQRVAAAALRLPSTFWYLALVLIVTTVGLSTMIEPISHHTIGIAAQGFAIALLAALVFITDTPFMGDTSIQPTSFNKAIALIKARE